MIEKKLLVNQMIEAYPIELRDNINNILKKIELQSDYFYEYTEEYVINNEVVKIPYRIYSNPEILNSRILDDESRRILSSYFTRHNNGYIRQKALKNIIYSKEIFDYEIPFLLRLCGEYVIEILIDAFEGIKKIDDEIMIKFIQDNLKVLRLNEARMISYWSEYYRQKSYGITYRPAYKEWSNYPASSLLKYLENYGHASIKRK